MASRAARPTHGVGVCGISPPLHQSSLGWGIGSPLPNRDVCGLGYGRRVPPMTRGRRQSRGCSASMCARMSAVPSRGSAQARADGAAGRHQRRPACRQVLRMGRRWSRYASLDRGPCCAKTLVVYVTRSQRRCRSWSPFVAVTTLGTLPGCCLPSTTFRDGIIGELRGQPDLSGAFGYGRGFVKSPYLNGCLSATWSFASSFKPWDGSRAGGAHHRRGRIDAVAADGCEIPPALPERYRWSGDPRARRGPRALGDKVRR
jgi:hypothetical protein